MRVPKSFIQKIPWIVSLLFILLFVYAAVTKLMGFNTFQAQLGQSPLLGALAQWVSWGVVIIELVVAGLLTIGRMRLLGLYLSFLLMVLFTVYIIVILNFTVFVPCSCGGVLEDLGWTEHLVFNLMFLLLALLSIYLMDQRYRYRILGVGASGIGTVMLLFLLSEKELKRNNAFQRRYIPHALEKIGKFQLESNAFYIAGIDSTSIYLGNFNAPLYLKIVNRNLSVARDIKVDIQNYGLPYKRVRIEVRSPNFFVGDGTVPIVFGGETDKWKASVFSHDDAFFYQFTALDSLRLGILTTSSRTGENTLGLLTRKKDSIFLRLEHGILNAQMDGTFDTDGMILWNSQIKKLLYVYYYRNQYEVSDGELNLNFTGKTIDTITRAQLEIARFEERGESTLGKATLVNRYASTYGDFLYVNSDRIGKYEDVEVLKSAGIIDQYNLSDNAYEHSFYFYHQPGAKLREFKVIGNAIIGLVNDMLWVYRFEAEAHH